MIPPLWEYTASELEAAIKSLEGFLRIKPPKNTAPNSTKKHCARRYKTRLPKQTKRKPQSLKCLEESCENEVIHPLVNGTGGFCLTHFRHGEES